MFGEFTIDTRSSTQSIGTAGAWLSSNAASSVSSTVTGSFDASNRQCASSAGAPPLAPPLDVPAPGGSGSPRSCVRRPSLAAAASTQKATRLPTPPTPLRTSRLRQTGTPRAARYHPRGRACDDRFAAFGALPPTTPSRDQHHSTRPADHYPHAPAPPAAPTPSAHHATTRSTAHPAWSGSQSPRRPERTPSQSPGHTAAHRDDRAVTPGRRKPQETAGAGPSQRG
jgi:hypothetical protein